MDEFVPPIEDLEYGARRVNDGRIWYRADAVEAALNKALQVSIRNHQKFLGNDVKSVCWDVREEFEKALRPSISESMR
jgi:hypothetical protein